MVPSAPLLLEIRPGHFRATVEAVIEHYVEPDLQPRLRKPNDALQLGEDLGLDSLSLMEVAIRLEDVLQISIPDEELRDIRTLGQVHELVERALARKIAGQLPPATGST